MTKIDEVNGIGAFFYPFLVLVSENKPGKHSQELQAPTTPRRRVVKLIHQIPTGEKILISDDGFVGVFDTDKKSARHLLNTIFATAITYGIGSEILTSFDICKFVYDRVHGSILIGYSNGPSERTMFAFQRDDPREKLFHHWRVYKSRTGYHPDVIKKIFNTVSDYIKNPTIRQDLILLLEGYTLYYREAYRGAYLYGWMLVETFLSKFWEEYVKSLKRSQNDKVSLMDNRSWTSYHHIEMFSALEKMSPVVRNLLHALRKKRNHLVHEKMDPDKEEAFECLNLAAIMNMNILRNPSEPFSRVEKEIKLIEKWGLDR
jgi:hypothetical protein